MDVWKLLWFCVIYHSAVLQAISVETQAGLSVRVVMETHVYQNNQSDFFRFEVQSCENVDVILNGGGRNRMSVFLTLSQTNNGSVVKVCHRPTFSGTEGCSQVGEEFMGPDFCLTSAVFWVWNEQPVLHTIGHGCTKGAGKLADLQLSTGGVDTAYFTLEVKSMTSAQWKFGEAVCAPPTTTVKQTTISPLENVDQSSATATTTAGNDLNNTLKCPTVNGSLDRSSAEVTCSETWPVMTLAFAYTLMCSM